MSVASFYSDARLGNRFGVSGPFYGSKGHLGQDWVHREGVPIPSWTDGVVARVQAYGNLGNTIVIRRPDGTFAGFAHMQARSKLAVGESVTVGQIVGLVGNTGTSSTGPHLHSTLEPTSSIGTTNAIDPLPHIHASLADFGLVGDGQPITIPKRRNKNMGTLYHLAGSDPTRYALAGGSPGTPANWLETTAQSLANDWSAQIGGPSAGLNQQTWDEYKRSYLSPLNTLGGSGGSFDDSRVLEAIADVQADVNKPRTVA